MSNRFEREAEEAPALAQAAHAAQPAGGYAGGRRYTQLEYEAVLANASIGIAFTRERKFFLCNAKFEEMFGWRANQLIGQPGEVVCPSRESYDALGEIAAPILGAGRQLDLEWEVRRRDGSTFLCRMIAKAVNAARPQQGTIWIVEDITARKRAEEEIRRLAAEQQQIFDNATIGILFVRNRVIQRCNRRLEEMTGASPGELDGCSTELLFAQAQEWRRATDAAYRGTAPGGTHQAEVLFRRKDGSTFLARNNGRRFDAGTGEPAWIWIIEDITEQRSAQEAIKRALAEQELILANATVGIAFQRHRTFQRCNPRFEEMFGYSPGETSGRSAAFLFADRRAYLEASKRALSALAAGGSYAAELPLRRKDGSRVWCKVIGKAIDPARLNEGTIWIYDDVSAEHAVRETLEASRAELKRAVAERTTELEAANRRLEAEITERKQAEERAQHLADHDALTGLPNRRLLEDRLTQALALSNRNRKLTAVMFVDLDRFKAINDSLGHAAGDALLKEVARRLLQELRAGDTICRLGGDEFVVVLPEIKRPSDAANVAQKIIESVSRPMVLENRELRVTPSIGMAVFPDDGRDGKTLIHNADAAMYHAKETGRASYQFFTEQMNLAATRRLGLENDLRRALHKGELALYYQPVVELRNGRIVGHEALPRWRHPAQGLMAPSDFIPLAEETGLILGIGEWVLGEACRWASCIGTERGLTVGVTLSARQFRDPKLAQLVALCLEQTGLSAGQLELEISESAVMQHTDVALAALARLKGLGVSLALDDFGTGYSSLAGLRRFSVDKLKIDGSLVADLAASQDARVIVAASVGLAHALGLKAVAKGVATEPQRQFLERCGCDYLQGDLAGRPAAADTAAKEYL